jgi:hypothetical protein
MIPMLTLELVNEKISEQRALARVHRLCRSLRHPTTELRSQEQSLRSPGRLRPAHR